MPTNILLPLFNNNKEGTLFKTLNKTISPQGNRLLSKHINNPLTNKIKIKKRLSYINELVNNLDLLNDIRSLLKEISDIERIISKISNNKSNPKDV